MDTPLNLKLVHCGHTGGGPGNKNDTQGGSRAKISQTGQGLGHRTDTEGGSGAQVAQTGGVEGNEITRGVVQGTEINWWGGPGHRNHMGWGRCSARQSQTEEVQGRDLTHMGGSKAQISQAMDVQGRETDMQKTSNVFTHRFVSCAGLTGLPLRQMNLQHVDLRLFGGARHQYAWK